MIRYPKIRWQISVADANHTESFAVTDMESTALLRAWLNPLPPPPVEQLEELAG